MALASPTPGDRDAVQRFKVASADNESVGSWETSPPPPPGSERPTCRETVSPDSRRMVAPLAVVAVTAATILHGWLRERGRQPAGPEGWACPGTAVAESVRMRTWSIARRLQDENRGAAGGTWRLPDSGGTPGAVAPACLWGSVGLQHHQAAAGTVFLVSALIRTSPRLRVAGILYAVSVPLIIWSGQVDLIPLQQALAGLLLTVATVLIALRLPKEVP